MTVKELKAALADYPDSEEVFIHQLSYSIRSACVRDVCMVPVGDGALFVEDVEVPSHVPVDPDNPYIIGVLIDWRRNNDKK